MNLTGADLTGADLTGVDLTGANLTGADLTGATLPVINTLTDSSAVSLSVSKTYGGNTLDSGIYSIDLYEGNDPTIELRQIFDTNSNGYFSYGGSQTIQFRESEGARYSDIVADINNNVFTITNPT